MCVCVCLLADHQLTIIASYRAHSRSLKQKHLHKPCGEHGLFCPSRSLHGSASCQHLASVRRVPRKPAVGRFSILPCETNWRAHRRAHLQHFPPRHLHTQALSCPAHTHSTHRSTLPVAPSLTFRLRRALCCPSRGLNLHTFHPNTFPLTEPP